MKKQTPLASLTRRRFLLVAGAAAVPLIAKGIPHLALAPTTNQHITLPRIGVLLPRSFAHPTIGENLLAGMQLYFAGERLEAELLVEEIDSGTGLARKKTKQLLEADGVGLVTGLLNSIVAVHLRSIFEEQEKPLLVNTVGANLIPENAHSPYLFYNSLGYWQASWVTGQRLAQQGHRRALMTASLYDSGYDALYAFRQGFEAGGGTVVEAHVSGVRADEELRATLAAKVEAHHPDVVYALYSGQSAVEFVKAYGSAAAGVPLYGAGFTVDESLLAKQGDAAQGVGSIATWAPTLDVAENQTFVTKFKEATGRSADAFAVLGYDTARMIVEAVRSAGSSEGPALASALEAVRFTSPRGPLHLDPTTRSTVTPLYLRRVAAGRDGWQNVVVGEEKVAVGALELAGQRSGWLNPYLCV